jgi:hypothetical protein
MRHQLTAMKAQCSRALAWPIRNRSPGKNQPPQRPISDPTTKNKQKSDRKRQYMAR